MNSCHYMPTDSSCVFHYNSDFGGDVIIETDTRELTIPATAILEFVARCYVEPKLTREIENLDATKLLMTAIVIR